MILPFDELNNVQRKLDEEAVISTEDGVKRYDPEKACDIILDYLIYCYAMGIDNANEMLFTSIKGNADEMREVIYKRIEGKTFEDRVREYAEESEDASTSAENPPRGGETERGEEVAAEDGERPQGGSGDVSGTIDVFGVSENGLIGKILRVAETEGHRVLNQAMQATAEKGGATTKTWVTMEDDRVRDTHDYLLGETVGIDDLFVTYDGDSAMFPGGFEEAENNVNCRCWLEYK